MTTLSNESASVPSPGPKGLGGWLVIPIAGFWVTAATSMYSILFRKLLLFFDGTWGRVTDSSSSDFHPLMGTALIFDLVSEIGLLGWVVLLLILIHTKSSAAPRQAVLFMIVQIVIAIVAYALLWAASSEGASATGVASLVRSAVVAGVWIVYFTESRRVKATFVQ